MSWNLRKYLAAGVLGLIGFTVFAGHGVASEVRFREDTSASVYLAADEPARLQRILDIERQTELLEKENQTLRRSLSQEGVTSLTKQSINTQSRTQRIKEHNERIRRIVKESRERRAAMGTTATVETKVDANRGDTSSTTQSRDARIQEHQARIQQIIDESRQRREAIKNGDDPASAANRGMHIKTKIPTGTTPVVRPQTMEERQEKLEQTRRQLDAYIKSQTDE